MIILNQPVKFPACVAHLDSSLPDVDGNDLPHGGSKASGL